MNWVKEQTDDELENEITLVGVTAVEDLLYDDVKECISKFI